MRRAPITAQNAFHAFIKGTPFVRRPKRRQWKELSTLTFRRFTFVEVDFDKRKLPGLLRQRKTYLSGLRWDRDDGGIKAWRQSPASAITAQELSVYFSFLTSFLGLFYPFPGFISHPSSSPPPSLRHMVRLHCKSVQNFTTYHASSAAMAAGHDQMCSGSDRRYQQGPTPTDIQLIHGVSQPANTRSWLPGYGAFESWSRPK